MSESNGSDCRIVIVKFIHYSPFSLFFAGCNSVSIQPPKFVAAMNEAKFLPLTCWLRSREMFSSHIFVMARVREYFVTTAMLHEMPRNDV